MLAIVRHLDDVRPVGRPGRTSSDTPAYLPFGAGPHACIGRQLALTEAQLVLAGLLARFEAETTAGAIEGLSAAGVLQPRGDVTATVRTS